MEIFCRIGGGDCEKDWGVWRVRFMGGRVECGVESGGRLLYG